MSLTISSYDATASFDSEVKGTQAEACTLITSGLYRADAEAQGPPGSRPGAGNGGWSQEPIPAPVVAVREVVRGTVPPGTTCDDAGRIRIEVAMPENAAGSLDDFGIRFRASDPKNRYAFIFPDIPLVPGKTSDGTYEIFLVWLDGSPIRQGTIDMTVDAVLVTADRRNGPATRFRVYSKPGRWIDYFRSWFE